MRAEEGNAKDLLCKSFVAEIKDMPLYERLNTKNEMRGIVFKCQIWTDDHHLLCKQKS